MLSVSILGAVLAAILPAQVPAPMQKPQPFVVNGCLHGTTLKTTEANSSGVSVDVYRLRGPKQLMRALREYEEHELEITGTLKDPEGRMGATRVKRLSAKTKLTAGVREDRNTQQPADPELTVESFRVLRPRCGR